jgi:preprotein translocase subunit SecF
MEFFKRTTHIDFIGKRRFFLALSAVSSIAVVVLLVVRGFNFGLDFTGGTLVELSYANPVETAAVRGRLTSAGMADAVVQHFGTSRDVIVRLPLREQKASLEVSGRIVEVLREAEGEKLLQSRPGEAQRCVRGDKEASCAVQVRRVEFVGPQVGRELAEKGGLALLYTLIAILIYVMFRFEWRFAVGAIIATAHDVLLVLGFFSLTQMEFSLSVLAAVLAVLGYSLNDTIVVYDRIRENYRRMRKESNEEIMNAAVNQTLSRTIMTSGTTMLTVAALFVFGGEIIHGFSVALLVGIVVGTYSSVYVATPAVLMLGVSRGDLVKPKKDTSVDETP